MGDFEGLHFLAAFEGDNADSDDDNASWCSGLTSETNDDLLSSNTADSDPIEWLPEECSVLNPFPFTGESGMKFNIENPQPIDIFNCICKPVFITKMILGTNAYARKQQKVDEEHYGHWKTLTVNEMRQFIGLVFHTGTIRMNNLSDYWSTERLIDLKIFRATMTLNRFLRILTALRFGNEWIHQEDVVSSSMAFNLMLGDFMLAMRSVCYPGRNLVIDNCQVVTKQDIYPLEGFDMTFAKPQMLIHSLSEPNGLVHNVQISGITKINYDETISSLTFDKRKRGHSIFLGKPYCKIDTVRRLALEQTYSTGIVDADADSVPDELRFVELDKGGQPAMLFANPGICLLRWRCRQDIYAISSEFRSCQDNMTTYSAGSQVVKAPLMIRKCRKIRMRADRKELFSSFKPFEGMHLGCYRAIGLYFLRLMLSNSYILYCNYYKKITFHEFRMSVIESLLEKEPALDLFPVATAATVATEPNSSANHFPKKFPKRRHQRPLRKRCRVCLHNGKRTDTYYHCAECPNEPALCLEKCFADYHQKIANGENPIAKNAGNGSPSQDDDSPEGSEQEEDENHPAEGQRAKKQKTEQSGAETSTTAKKSTNGKTK